MSYFLDRGKLGETTLKLFCPAGFSLCSCEDGNGNTLYRAEGIVFEVGEGFAPSIAGHGDDVFVVDRHGWAAAR